jgi:predicted  nucleic acid-binding Zn ribbon protein
MSILSKFVIENLDLEFKKEISKEISNGRLLETMARFERTYQIRKEEKNMTNKTVYCPHCRRYGMESVEENLAVCPDCGGKAQWEDEVLKYRMKI